MIARRPWRLALGLTLGACSASTGVTSHDAASVLTTGTTTTSTTSTPSTTTTTRSTTTTTTTTTATATTTSATTTSATTTSAATTTTAPGLPEGISWCAYRPGNRTAPPHADTAPPGNPDFPTPAPATVDASVTEQQHQVLDQLDRVVRDHYVDPDLNDVDWTGRVRAAGDAIDAGLDADGFALVMKGLVAALGDQHSYYESPQDVADEEATSAGRVDYVGIGVYAQDIPEAGGSAVIFPFAGSPAEAAGITAHDLLTKVDGQPAMKPDDPSYNPFLGPAGTTITVELSHPFGPPETVRITRRRVHAPLPLGTCVVPGTRVAYVLVPSLVDTTVDDRLADDLAALTADGPLDGLVIDNRMNPGGSLAVLQPILSLFLEGTVGRFRTRTDPTPLTLDAHDVGGSQTLPLVVLVGGATNSFGEVMSGILQAQGRATVIGSTTRGNVEVLNEFEFDDGSRAWIATQTFDPDHAAYGPWEDTGIRPDVVLPTRWDLFTAATDPALGAAVDLLTG